MVIPPRGFDPRTKDARRPRQGVRVFSPMTRQTSLTRRALSRLAAAFTLAGAARAEAEAGPHGGLLGSNVRVALRGGVKVATPSSRPAPGGNPAARPCPSV